MALICVACEESAIVRDAFIMAGHDARSVDLQPSRSLLGPHYQGDIGVYLSKHSTPRFDLIIAHPPCTYLNNAGVRWLHAPDSAVEPLKGEPRRQAMLKGAQFFNWFKGPFVNVDRYCIENPVMNPYAAALCGQWTQTVQPWQFGEPQFKRTAFWLHNLPPLTPTKVLTPPKAGTAEHKAWSKVHRASPGKDRAKIRSTFFRGMAQAMAAQWGPLL